MKNGKFLYEMSEVEAAYSCTTRPLFRFNFGRNEGIKGSAFCREKLNFDPETMLDRNIFTLPCFFFLREKRREKFGFSRKS